LNKNINVNIADVALTAYKNAQNGKVVNINTFVKTTIVSIGVELIRNNLIGQHNRNTKTKQMIVIGGLIFLGLSSVKRY